MPGKMLSCSAKGQDSDSVLSSLLGAFLFDQAAVEARQRIFPRLIEEGANVNYTDTSGWCPLSVSLINTATDPGLLSKKLTVRFCKTVN